MGGVNSPVLNDFKVDDLFLHPYMFSNVKIKKNAALKGSVALMLQTSSLRFLSQWSLPVSQAGFFLPIDCTS